jgi:ketosteroid isomerase-like protein
MTPEVEAVADRFAGIWAAPSVQDLGALMHSEIVMLQPILPPIRGREDGMSEFSKLLKWLPDLRGVVDERAAAGNRLMIAWRLQFTLGQQPFELRLVDRIVVKDGLIAEREAYYDSLAFAAAVLSRPSAWFGYLRYRGYFS